MSPASRALAGVLLLLLIAGAGCGKSPAAMPRAVGGALDLSGWSPEREGPVRLDGEWGFHWRRLVAPGDTAALETPTELATVPGAWPGADAFATYQLRVRLPRGRHDLVLRLLTVSTAYRLYADGQLVAVRGRVADDAASGSPEYRPLTVEVPATGRRSLDLVLQASNFHYAKGGLWEPVWLGTAGSIQSLREANVALTLFLIGSFAIIGLYHLFLWLARRSEPSAFYFGVLCVAVIARVLTVDEMYLVTLVPSLPWSLHVRIEYLSILAIGAVYAPFLRSLFPDEIPRWLAPTVLLSGLAMALVILVTPPRLFSRGLPVLQLYLVSGTIVAPALAARAASRPGDTVARYGGEELVALLSDTGEAGAHEVAERMRRQVADIGIPHEASDVVPVVSVSVGVATLIPKRDTPPELLVERADGALYKAKRAGRNCVRAH